MAPSSMPSLECILDDIGADHSELAKYLGVNRSTVTRWVRRGAAPRAVTLALFWHTRWGRSAVHCDAENRARQLWGRFDLASRDRDALQLALDAVVQVGDFGSANAPTTKAGAGAPPQLSAAQPAELRASDLARVDVRMPVSRGRDRRASLTVESVALEARA